jgi:mevalonate kinase
VLGRGQAPGKIILFGEHAVVYGRPAVAVPVIQVQVRASITLAKSPSPDNVLIKAPDIGLKASLAELPAGHPLKAAIQRTATALNISRLPACTIRITSTIPVAAGLGSGAAVTVAIARTLSAALGSPLDDEQVCALAYEVEKIHHGTPSGIDNTVITYARPVYFIKGKPIQQLSVGRAFTIVIGDTGIASPTAKAVGDVRQAWQADKDHLEAMFDSIGAIADSARQVIEQGAVELLGPLMDANHGLLRKLGVSCPELDALVLTARKAGAWGAKLSGGGRGGNMIALVNQSQAAKVAAALQSAGAVRTLVTEIKASKG